MRLKSFFGASLSEAMAQVRAALGDDAIIIATRDEEMPDGTAGVRITAAVDEQPIAESAATPAPTSPAPNLIDALDDDVMDAIADALQRHGTPATLAEHIAAEAARNAGGDAVQALAAGLQAVLKFGPLPAGADARMLVLVGPPGAGKTAMIGKLAARAALAGKKVAAITTDLERAGGVAQLAAYTATLKVPLMEVEDADALADALFVHKDADQVFIDSTGINPFSAADAAGIAKIIKATKGVAVLVLPAGLEPLDAAEMATAFRLLGAAYLLPTRLDLTRRLGSLLAVAHDARLQLCEASASPAIAAGLVTLDAMGLAKRLLPTPLEGQVNLPIAEKTQDSTSLATKTANYVKR